MNHLIWKKENALKNGLCIESVGMGQDSTAIFYKFLTDKDFALKKLDGRSFMMIFADTGNERDDVYAHAWKVKDLCAAYGIKFIHLAHPLVGEIHREAGRSTDHLTYGFHSDAWAALAIRYSNTHSLAMRSNKSCTDNLKIKPIYRFLNAFCAELMGEEEKSHGKKNIVAFAESTTKIEMMIGFAVGEENRMKKAETTGKESWWSAIDKTFPLITDLGMSRMDCIEFMESTPWGACGPSMCKFCPNITKQTLVLMWLEDRSSFIQWAKHERDKLNKWAPIQEAKGAANSTALGRKGTLIEELRSALEEFKDWSLEDLKEYDFKNGHCISNGY